MEEYTEWRVVAKVPDRGSRLDAIIAETLTTCPPDIDIHRRGSREILIYAFSEDDVRAAERELTRLLARDAIPVETRFTRWNPGRERWQDPSLAVEPARRRLPPEWIEVGELGYEVRMKFQTVDERRRLQARFESEGRPMFTDGWKRLLLGAVDETEANALAGQLRLQTPLTELQVRPLTRFRRWLIRQHTQGNFGAGSGGDWNGGGGGNGGGG